MSRKVFRRCNLCWSSSLAEHRAVSLGCCLGRYYCCLLKPEPSKVPSCGHRVLWGPCYVLTHIPLSLCEYLLWFLLARMEMISAFISGEDWHSLKLLPHLIFHIHKLLWGRCSLGAVAASLLPFSFPGHASCTDKISQGIVASPYWRGEMVAGSWEKPLGTEGNNGMKHPGCIFQRKV